jgi:hypothetical protein
MPHRTPSERSELLVDRDGVIWNLSSLVNVAVFVGRKGVEWHSHALTRHCPGQHCDEWDSHALTTARLRRGMIVWDGRTQASLTEVSCLSRAM